MEVTRWACAALLSSVAVLAPAPAAELVAELRGHTDEVACVTFSPDGKLLASCGRDTTSRLWNLGVRGLTGVSDKRLEQLVEELGDDDFKVREAAGDELKQIAFVARARLQAAMTKATSLEVKSRLGEILRTVAGKTLVIREHALLDDLPARLWSVAFSPDGELLATGGSADRSQHLWHVPTRSLKGSLPRRIRSVAFSPKGRWLAVAGGDFWLVDSQTGESLRPHYTPSVGRSKNLWATAWSHDGKLVATAGEGPGSHARVYVFHATTRRVRHATNFHKQRVWSLAFSPDGKRIASASHDKTVRVWTLADGKNRTITGHAGPVRSVAFSPDGRLIATASQDRTARLWDAKTLKPVFVMPHPGLVYTLAFSPNGEMLATGAGDGIVRLWRTSR